MTADEQQELTTITRRPFGEPDAELPFVHGRSVIVTLGPEEVWRSELEPGWNWDEDLGPYAEGATSCPMTHREYVVEGRIRYVMEDGTEIDRVPRGRPLHPARAPRLGGG